MQVVGLDVGGANLKAAHAEGEAITRPFAVWKSPERLAAEIGRLLEFFSKPDAVALTMTAELADCYRTKREGVEAVIAAVEQAAGSTPVRVWQTKGQFVTPAEARRSPALVAAANWHALATFVGRLAPVGAALLIDIGTTTTDLIPLSNGVPCAAGRTDRERLQTGELVYTGVTRTPICAVVGSVPYRGNECPIAAELFATTLDVHVALGDLPENANDLETADGRPATKSAARDRMARCLCCDATEFDESDMQQASLAIAAAQRRQIARGIESVLVARGRVLERLLLSGAGAFLAERTIAEIGPLASAERIKLSDRFGPPIAEAACAYALARLAIEDE